jgi:hypothetical protein
MGGGGRCEGKKTKRMKRKMEGKIKRTQKLKRRSQ